MFKLVQLDFVVLVLIDLSEDGINILYCDWEMDLILLEELCQELS